METTDRDPNLWRMAKARAKFKAHLMTYLLVNALLWAIWFLTGHHDYGTGLPWPIWSTVFWGFGVLMQGVRAYGFAGRREWSEQEYQRLLRNKETGQ
ncbi:2TM domain-containing protein [Hymenobacter busanensis]|uniref:2TM domain-containing protein n=1 Tax=Hymenobacter busanensis TaxID=2607656 RepID=A0A7L4ZWC4_9BACT|nr:2TM domain-containing protein [Hymenobacter busanensis]KAA9332130.1 2TM domain-containing protein [Hymenobacter busanensis]QHJ07531.1 hypothetical protein GUY19_09650 [Hymenobacter busanensis]